MIYVITMFLGVVGYFYLRWMAGRVMPEISTWRYHFDSICIVLSMLAVLGGVLVVLEILMYWIRAML